MRDIINTSSSGSRKGSSSVLTMGDSNTVMEVPLLFPSLDVSSPVFILNDTEKTIRRKQQTTPDESSDVPGLGSRAFADDAVLRGSASVSSVSGLVGGTGAVLTTCLLVETPWILSVALARTKQEPPVTMRLDLGSETQMFSSIAKVQAFAVGGDEIQLTLIDEYGVIVSMNLNASTLFPIHETIQVLVIADLLHKGMDERVAPASLRSSMIVFLSSTKLVLSLNPFILAVDLDSEELVVWSKTKCLTEMEDRKSSMNTLWNKGVGLVLGPLKQDLLVDMNPTSALCVANNDLSQVFTLHSDGIVRRWKMSPDSLSPWSVSELAVPGLPDSETWSDASQSTVLCARLYGQVFVLAVHVLTNGSTGTNSTSLAEEEQTDCFLAVVHGLVDNYEHFSAGTQLGLKVPPLATSLVGMSFDARSERCSLVALFQSASEQQDDWFGSIYATYPPSVMSIVSTQPVVAGQDYFLEGVAQQERERIEALSYYDVLQDDLTLAEVLHQVDSRFLQFLFRPVFPRGTGSVLAPSSTYIRRALQKLVHKYSGRNNETAPCSIELETLRGMHEWRAKEKRKIISMTPVKKAGNSNMPATPGTDMANTQGGLSLYESLVVRDEDEDDDDVGFEYADEIDRDMESQVKDHEGRWRRLLLEIWAEEQMERLPLCLGMPESAGDSAILVRPGATSVITKDNRSDEKGFIASVDEIALKVVHALEDDPMSSSELASAERKAWEVLSKFQTALDPPCVLRLKERLGALGRSALYEVTTSQQSRKIQNAIGRIPETELILALQKAPFGSDLPGLCALNGDGDSLNQIVRQNPVASSHVRLAASSLSIRSANSARRLLLGRFLVLSELDKRLQVSSACLLMYLHSVTVSWTFAQQVGMPLVSPVGPTGRLPTVRFEMPGESPPTKRPSLGSGGSSNLTSLGMRDGTIALDALLISLSQRIDLGPSSMSLSGLVTLLADSAFRTSFRFAADFAGEQLSFSELPELGVLAASPGDGIAHPKLALRLLAPFVALENPNESRVVVPLREELLARCLVLASRSESRETASEMVQRACHLLKFDDLDLEKMNYRLSILDRNIGEDSRLSGMLLELIQNAISQMENHFPEDIRRSMKEYVSLWSTLFNTAISAHKWDTAYVAALNNPELERRANSFKRLVRAMVDAGALTELLEMCASVGSESTTNAHIEVFRKGVDMYAIAAETLAEESFRDLYLFLVIDPEPLSDYQGALYALHVSQGQWRRAAQALDLRYSNAIEALASGPAGSQLDHAKTALREGLIINDLVLAALGCRNAVGLVRDIDSRFIVSGEHGPHPLTLHTISKGGNTGTKRGRLFSHNKEASIDDDDDTDNRLDRFMNLTDLEVRGVRSMALRTLFNDETTDPSLATSIFCAQEFSNNSHRAIMDELFIHGYYQHGLMLGIIMSKAQGSLPDGRNLFHDSLSHMMCTYLVPLAVDRSFAPTRPSLSQLHSALNTVGQASDSPPFIVGSRSKKISLILRSDIRLGAMALLQSLTTAYTTAENPVAIEVADMLLDVQGIAVPLPLPSWLERLLLWGTNKDDAPGLFARRPQTSSSGYLGDPSALLSLYTKRGMYHEAFTASADLLSAFREGTAPSRLPEKGNIDYVPYDKIDILWNLSEIALASGDFDEVDEHRLLDSRERLEQSLEKHFALLKISEEGQRSARALS